MSTHDTAALPPRQLTAVYPDGCASHSGIYQIRHLPSGRVYVGSAACFRKRFDLHRRQLLRGVHPNRKLQAGYNKHGPGAFVFEVVELAGRTGLLAREQHYLDEWKPFYNIATNAVSPRLGVKSTPEQLARRAACARAIAAKISATLRGRPGRSPSEEARAKTSKALMGHPVSPETRAKIRANVRPWTHTADAKARIGLASRQRPRSPEHNKKIAQGVKASWGKRRLRLQPHPADGKAP